MVKHTCKTALFILLGIIVLPPLYSIAAVCSVAPAITIIYSFAAIFFDFPSIISVGGLNYDGIGQFLPALLTSLILFLTAAFCYAAIEKYLSYIQGELSREKSNSVKSQSMRKSQSVRALLKSQFPAVIKTVTYAVPVLILLLLICTVTFFIIDKLSVESYFTQAIFKKAVTNYYAHIWVITGLGSYRKLALWGCFATFLFIGLKTLLAVWKRKKKAARFAGIISLFINTSYLVFLLLCFINFMFVGYVDRVVGNSLAETVEAPDYMQKIEIIKDQLDDKNMGVTLALNKIIADVTDNPRFFDGMSVAERLMLCEKINGLIAEKEGPSNMGEHYFRNYLNYAPATLQDMIDTIANPRETKWILIEPGQSAYHMFGKDGEYNLKFVSENGLFEAVYNIDGMLLTEKNDAVNMGTYNYASPLSYPEKHIVYDVLPYNIWGNAMFSQSYTDDDALDNLDKFDANEKAIKRYNDMRTLISA